MKITVVGSGYVGMSMAALFAQRNDVMVHDIDPKRVEKINEKKSTISDPDIETFLIENKLNISATLDKGEAYENADFVVIAAPTNFDKTTDSFDTSIVDSIIADIRNINSEAIIVIKSTIPIGHTSSLQKKFSTRNIIFSPEFLREGKALADNLYPSRIIIGTNKQKGEAFADILVGAAKKKDIEILYMNSSEAEAVKLFSNTYLAMRVSFFNELDSFALKNRLDTMNIIEGVCKDKRIGDGYNNPSFGYGGYCLPKDTRQLLNNFENIPQSLIEATISSNSKRKDFIANEILKKNPKIVGVYRLLMKSNSDNFRSSAVLEVIDKIKKQNIKVVIFEPNFNADFFDGCQIIKDLESFKNMSDVIACNRVSEQIIDVKDKVFTRDFFKRD